jgi:hypothetical protein
MSLGVLGKVAFDEFASKLRTDKNEFFLSILFFFYTLFFCRNEEITCFWEFSFILEGEKITKTIKKRAHIRIPRVVLIICN